jgi:hypothetical protein
MISRILKAAMVGIHAVKATVGILTKDSVGTGVRVDRELPNEATIIPRALTMTMRSVRAVSATVATSRVNLEEAGARIERNLAKRSQLPEAGMNSDRECSDRKPFFAKTKPIYLNARSHRTSRPEGIDRCTPFSRKRSQFAMTHVHVAPPGPKRSITARRFRENEANLL